jgi:hypothetical protein
MENRLEWALSACARILRPVIKLALSVGLKHHDLDRLLRDLLLHEARRSWLAKGIEPNISQLSVTTGLNRKAVTTRMREPRDSLPQTERSTAAKTVTLWLEMIDEAPDLLLLPIVAKDDRLSFESLARQASRGNVHHRTVLDELVRLNLVKAHDDHVELITDDFVPVKDMPSMLAFLGDNARDHLLAGVSNTLGEGKPMLERSIFANGLSATDCERLQQLVRQRWRILHAELAREMRRAVEAAGGEGSSRIRIGIYAYHEDASLARDAATAGKPVKAAKHRHKR